MRTEIILKEGYPYIGGSFAVFLLSLMVSESFFWHIFWFGVFAFFVYFFRNPERIPEDASPNAVISPSDGTVIEIAQAVSPISKKESIKISIRLSLFDVHIQRSPIEGEMIAREYIKGAFLALSSEKASELNEQNRILFSKDIEVNQIAGFITRRIVMFRDLGAVFLGERYGMIMFGSQVDLYLPKDSVIKITEFQKLKAGESLIGYLNED
ncbi:MAG: phosphatidylserine decarboxylase family protein [Epsilonproteobacteria bacterium]|nr:phosphatidylserine decarboxylase family protein [Campylobacterota bacterium]